MKKLNIQKYLDKVDYNGPTGEGRSYFNYDNFSYHPNKICFIYEGDVEELEDLVEDGTDMTNKQLKESEIGWTRNMIIRKIISRLKWRFPHLKKHFTRQQIIDLEVDEHVIDALREGWLHIDTYLCECIEDIYEAYFPDVLFTDINGVPLEVNQSVSWYDKDLKDTIIATITIIHEDSDFITISDGFTETQVYPHEIVVQD